MQKLFLFLLTLISIGSLLIIDQIWFSFLTQELFVKVMVTLGLILAFITISYLLYGEFVKEKKLKDNDFTN